MKRNEGRNTEAVSDAFYEGPISQVGIFWYSEDGRLMQSRRSMDDASSTASPLALHLWITTS